MSLQVALGGKGGKSPAGDIRLVRFLSGDPLGQKGTIWGRCVDTVLLSPSEYLVPEQGRSIDVLCKGWWPTGDFVNGGKVALKVGEDGQEAGAEYSQKSLVAFRAGLDPLNETRRGRTAALRSFRVVFSTNAFQLSHLRLRSDSMRICLSFMTAKVHSIISYILYPARSNLKTRVIQTLLVKNICNVVPFHINFVRTSLLCVPLWAWGIAFFVDPRTESRSQSTQYHTRFFSVASSQS